MSSLNDNIDIDEYRELTEQEGYEPPADPDESLLLDLEDEEDETTDDADNDEATGDEPPAEQDEPPADNEDQKPPAKTEQSPEENARFAEQRRQRQVREALEQTPEFQLVQQLSKVTGKSPEQLITDMREAEIKRMAEASGEDIAVVRARETDRAEREQEAVRLRDENAKLQFNQWKTRVDGEGQAMKAQFPVLTDDDLTEAQNYILLTLKNVDIPLEQAVHAVHGKKIIDWQREQAKTEALAEASGRNKPLPPGGAKAKSGPTLSEAERRMARDAFGMSDEEYLKYKNQK